jgi:hypothetical protein
MTLNYASSTFAYFCFRDQDGGLGNDHKSGSLPERVRGYMRIVRPQSDDCSGSKEVPFTTSTKSANFERIVRHPSARLIHLPRALSHSSEQAENTHTHTGGG